MKKQSLSLLANRRNPCIDATSEIAKLFSTSHIPVLVRPDDPSNDNCLGQVLPCLYVLCMNIYAVSSRRRGYFLRQAVGKYPLGRSTKLCFFLTVTRARKLFIAWREKKKKGVWVILILHY